MMITELAKSKYEPNRCVPFSEFVKKQHAARDAVASGILEVTKRADDESQCNAENGEVYFWCQNDRQSTDGYDHCGDQSSCPVNSVHPRKQCCFCGGCLKKV